MKQVPAHFITEPLTWFFYCFFQPERFKKEFEIEGFWNMQRIGPMLKLVFPAFLLSFPFVTVAQASIAYFYPHYPVPGPDIGNFLSTIVLDTLLGIILSTLLGIAIGYQFGIMVSLPIAIASGVVGGTERFLGSYIVLAIPGGIVGMAAGAAIGTATGVVISMARHCTKRLRVQVIRGITGGIAGGIIGSSMSVFLVIRLGTTIMGLPWGIVGGIIGGTIGGLVGGIMVKRGKGIGANLIHHMGRGFTRGVAGGVQVGYLLALVAASELEIGWSIQEGIHASVQFGTVKGVLLGILLSVTGGMLSVVALGTVFGLRLGITRGVILGVVGSIIAGIVSIQWGVIWIIPNSLVGSILFAANYIVGYYRLFLYPASTLFMLITYISCQKNRSQVFVYLHHSPVYWDECIFLPALGLKQILYIAAEQNADEALKRISFIVHERPQQSLIALEAALEIAICDLKMRDSMRDIASASPRLSEILPQDLKQLAPQSVKPFVRLGDISRDAIRYLSPLGQQAKQKALKDMLEQLDSARFHFARTSRHFRLNDALDVVINTWQEVIERELHRFEELEKLPARVRLVDNPYTPGQPLARHNPLFVGRRDLAQQLERSLTREHNRPTFLLKGERRMGKSSTLIHLPDLLGARYLPIFYNMQDPGIYAHASAFLGAIADAITKEMSERGLRIKKLNPHHLRDAEKENEAATYLVFSIWLKEVERTLEREDRILLLTFDEFERFEEAGTKGFIDLELLLDWFRDIIQYHPRLALLFSGVKTFGEMNTKWSGYFVNVQILKVGFLRPGEAYQLITQPMDNFPSDRIFTKVVIEEVIRITCCHPFLLQAVCSELIEFLRENECERIEVQNITMVRKAVLNRWHSYFQDLWDRTSLDQRTILVILKELGEGSLFMVEEQSGLDRKTTQRIMGTLIERDLVLCENDVYRIAVPILSDWIEYNN